MLRWRLPLFFALQVLVNLEATRTFREDTEQVWYSLVQEADASLDLGEFESLCSGAIVTETCKLLNNFTSLSLSTSRQVVAETLGKTQAETKNLWEMLGLPDETKCKDLCLALTKYIKARHVLPPRSDLACYSVGSRSFCDADLRVTSLPSAGMSKDEDLPDLHDDDEEDAATFPTNSEGLAVTPWHFVERVANLFRIYPAESPGDDARNGLMSDPEKARIAKKSEKIAQAFVSLAVREFGQKNTGDQTKLWFGESDAVDRTVRATLNSIADVLANVRYVYPGSSCQDRYAYVDRSNRDCSKEELRPGSDCTTSAGKYVIYLCEGFFTRPREQIAVLIHEASHQATAYTHDVCADATKPFDAEDCGDAQAYGRVACKALARFQSKKALMNADNFCYYVQDVVREGRPEAPLRVAYSSAKTECPKESIRMGRHCRCPRFFHCEQNGAGDCPFGLKRSNSEFLPSCKDCRCVNSGSRDYEEHPDCTEPCGSKVGGMQLDEDTCAKCEFDECITFQCPPRDFCKGVQCHEFSSCRVKRSSRGSAPNCVCNVPFHEDGFGHCVPDIGNDFKCCVSQGESVWYKPEDLYLRILPWPKSICPKKPRIWKKGTNCTTKVYGLNYP